MVNSDNIFKLLDEKGITAYELSKKTGISTGNISNWKTQKLMPNAQKLEVLADFFNCSIDYLLGREEESKNISEEHRKLIKLYEECSRAGQEEILKFAEYQKINNPKQKTTLSNSVG